MSGLVLAVICCICVGCVSCSVPPDSGCSGPACSGRAPPPQEWDLLALPMVAVCVSARGAEAALGACAQNLFADSRHGLWFVRALASRSVLARVVYAVLSAVVPMALAAHKWEMLFVCLLACHGAASLPAMAALWTLT